MTELQKSTDLLCSGLNAVFFLPVNSPTEKYLSTYQHSVSMPEVWQRKNTMWVQSVTKILFILTLCHYTSLQCTPAAFVLLTQY